MKNTTRFSKIISAILAVIMIFYFVPTSVYAEAIEAAGSASSNSDSSSAISNEEYIPINEVYEVVEKRTENTKVFRLEDGTYMAASYPVAVHYQNESGGYENINNKLGAGIFGI